MRAQLRGLLSLIAEERGFYAAGSLFVVVGIAAGLSYPLFVQRLIDEGVMAARMDRINTIGIILVLLLLAEGVATVLRDYFFNMAGERVTARLRRRVFDHLLLQEITFFDQQKTGELTTRLWSDIPVLARVTGEPFADALRFALFGVCGLALLFYTSPMLTVVVALVVPPIVLSSHYFGVRIKASSAEVQERYARSGAVAEQSLHGIRTVRAFSQEAAESRRFGHFIDASLRSARRKILAVGFLSGISFTLGEAGAVIAVWIGGILIVRGRMTTGALISFVLYAFLVARGFRNATEFWSETLRGLGATAWIFDLLERGATQPKPGGLTLPSVRGAITLDGVRFRYPTRPDVEALRGVTLAIDPGSIVAFVGRSGAGKSTILNLLLRFYDPTGGRLLLDGHDLLQLDASWLRERIGVVMQDPVLFSGTVADNIRYGMPGASDADVRRAAELAHAREFVDRLPHGFDTAVGDRGVQLSGGQRQRLAIARAVVRRPAILVFDEATSALDAESESLVHEALRALDYQPTTIVIAHRLSTVVNVDRVVVLDRGELVSAAPHDELLRTCPLYRQLVETQLVPV
jgi:ABC-type multidrug transport system fused ATPase/permease subunit